MGTCDGHGACGMLWWHVSGYSDMWQGRVGACGSERVNRIGF